MSEPSEPSGKPGGISSEGSAPSAPQSDLEAKPDPGLDADWDAIAQPSSEAGAATESAASAPGEAAASQASAETAANSAGPASLSETQPPVEAATVELTPEQLELIAQRRKDKTIGLVIISTTFVLGMIGSLWAKKLAEPELSEPPGPPTIEGVQNWPKHVDPVQALAVARKVTKRKLFRGFVAEMVKSDGTMDFTKKGPRVRYSFQSEPGDGPQPPRKSGTLPRRTYCGKQNVHIRELGVVADPDMASYPCSTKDKEPLPDPGCSLKQVWEYALKKGAPKKKVARIEYYRAVAGPAYRFNVPGTRHRFTIYGDCGRELKGHDAAGGVP